MKTWETIDVSAPTVVRVALGYLSFSSTEKGKDLKQMITAEKVLAQNKVVLTVVV